MVSLLVIVALAAGVGCLIAGTLRFDEFLDFLVALGAMALGLGVARAGDGYVREQRDKRDVLDR